MATFLGRDTRSVDIHVCSLCIMSICNLFITRGFEGMISVLIAPFPGHCSLVAFIPSCTEEDWVHN